MILGSSGLLRNVGKQLLAKAAKELRRMKSSTTSRWMPETSSIKNAHSSYGLHEAKIGDRGLGDFL